MSPCPQHSIPESHAPLDDADKRPSPCRVHHHIRRRGKFREGMALSANNIAWLVLTLVLYTLGNLIMLRLIRDVGMGVALSLSAIVQLVAVNVVAFAFFGERVSIVQATGLFMAIIAVAMITLGPTRG
jgi:multidrug transporter EmrE-like cation transporter